MIARVGKKNKAKGSSSGFKYKKRSADQVKKRADQRGGNFDSPVKSGIDMWRPQNGENVIRILPATWEDFEHYGYDVYMHRFIGSDSSNYLCLNKMKGKHCPACAEQKAAKDGGEEDEAKQLAYSKRCWVWIIDRADKKPTPQIWDMSWSQDRDISGLTYFKSGKVLLIDHPDDGYDVIVKKTGSGLKTKYSFNIERDSSPISEDEDEQEEILQFIQDNPIPTVLNFFSADHIAKKLEGMSEERDEDLDDDEDEDTPRKRKAGKRSRDDDDEDEDEAPRKKKRRPAEDEDEDEEDTPRRKKKRPADDDDEDEDERPKRKKRKSSDDDDDEDEEDETPRRRRKSSDDDDEDEDDKPKKKRRSSDDDDDEDERPAKKKKRKPADEDEDEEEEEEEDEESDDDDDEDEDEEDERPAKKKRRR